MLRQMLSHKANAVVMGSRMRWMMTGKKPHMTPVQKRALNPEQLQGTPGTAATKQDAVKPAAGGAGAGDTGGSSSMLPLAVAGLAVLGAGAYYFSTLETASSSDVKVAVTNSAPEETSKPETSKPETSSSSSVAEPSASSTLAPHRVVSIQVPPKMKHKMTAAAVAAAPHPELGNRVVMNPPPPPQSPITNKAVVPIDDATMTEKALVELRDSQTEQAAAALLESHHVAWSEMDKTYFNDLDSLSVSQLKARVVQLAMEMKDRTKWEAVRLKELLAMKDKESANQFMELMQKQRVELEDRMAQKLRDIRDEHTERMRQALKDKEATIQSVLQAGLDAQNAEHEAEMKAFEEITTAELKTALQNEYETKLLEFKELAARDMQQKVARLDALQKQLSHLEAALQASQTNKQGSVRAHKLSAAALALAEKLETNVGAETELKALKAAAGPEGVIATALSTIPAAVKQGVPTLQDLQARFEVVHKKSRQAALVPTGRPGLEGQLAGIMFAALKYPPLPDDAAPEADKDNAEYVLARAQKYLQLGQLERAVEQLEKLQGQAAFTVADWKKDAMTRVTLEKALKVIKMECALLNESLVMPSE